MERPTKKRCLTRTGRSRAGPSAGRLGFIAFKNGAVLRRFDRVEGQTLPAHFGLVSAQGGEPPLRVLDRDQSEVVELTTALREVMHAVEGLIDDGLGVFITVTAD